MPRFVRGTKTTIAVLVLISSSVNCSQRDAPARQELDDDAPITEQSGQKFFPDLPPATQVESGILLHEVALGEGELGKLWIYLPENSAKKPLPCILIAPAGNCGFLGMALGDTDRPEHLPYVRAGYAVVAYALDGHVKDLQHASKTEIAKGALAYMRAEAGLVNARHALDYLKAKIPVIDTQHIYTAGHSSAATISLCVAAREPRIKGCIAYAPGWTDLAKQLNPKIVRLLSDKLPGSAEFLSRVSPCTYAAELHCPLFLFHAKDDSMVPIARTEEFAAEVMKTNPNVEFVQASRGDHYNSMIDKGIPQAIQWLKTLDSK